MSKAIELPHFYEAQAKVLNSTSKFQTFVAGRRAGKTFVAHWLVIFASLTYQGALSTQSPQMVVAALPTLKQAKPIMWEPLVALFENDLADYCLKIDRSRNIIYPHVNGTPKPPIIVAGANDQNGDRLRGLRILFLMADEFQDWKPDVFNLIVRPAMADTPGSRAVFTGTPKGKLNDLYRTFELAEKMPDEYCSYQLKSSDNPFGMSLAEIASMKATLTPRQFRQEVEGSFEDFEGKVFSELDESNLVTSIPPGHGISVMGADWGDINPALVVWTKVGDTWFLREGWVGNFSRQSRNGSPVTMVTVKNEAYRLAVKFDIQWCYCDPSRPANILEFKGLGRATGQIGLARAIMGYNPIQEGLDYLHKLIFQKRLLIPKTLVSSLASCPSWQDVYDIFTAYHRAIDRNGTVLEDIAPGQVDDLIDATRYALVPNLSDLNRVTGDS